MSMSDSSPPNTDAVNAAGTSSPIISSRRPSATTTRQRPAFTPTGPRKPTSRTATSLVSSPPVARQFALVDQTRAVDRPPSYTRTHTDDSQALQALPPLPTSPPAAGIASNSRPSSRAAVSSSHGSRSATPAAMPNSPVVTSGFVQSPSASPRPAATSLTASPSASRPVSEDIQSQGTSLPYLQSESKPPTPAPEPPVLPPPLASPTVERAETAPATPSAGPPSTPKPRATTPMPQLAALAPPHRLDFASALAPSPFRKKTLTLSAAQWTLDSSDLQAIVSRAIRSSAEPSSIRLLPLDVLDKELAEEEKKLENERMEAMGKYRFGVHRRTLFVQSLNMAIQALAVTAGGSSSASSPPASATFSSADSYTQASQVLSNLSALFASQDESTESILRTSSQLAELRILREAHSTSALSVALRKLNASFARRTREVGSLKEQLEQLQAERDEAWRVAEDLAKEMDERAEWEDLEGEEFDDLTEVVVNGQRVVAAPATLTRVSRLGVKLRVPGVGPRVVIPGASRSPIKRRPSPLSVVTSEQELDKDRLKSPTASLNPPLTPPPAEPLPPPPAPPEYEEQPRTRQRSNSAASRVTAARTRSIRQSKASLRIPRELLANAAPGNTNRPKSSYSQRSTRSQGSMHSRTRSRSRVRLGTSSVPSSPLDGINKHPPLPIPSSLSPSTLSPASTSPQTATSEQIPEVPKIPSELLNLKAPVPRPPMPPMPPIPADPSPTSALANGSSFLDMITRPSSRSGTTSETIGATPVELTSEGLEKMRRSLEEVARSAVEGEEGKDDAIEAVGSVFSTGQAMKNKTPDANLGNENQSVMGSISPTLPNPFSPSSVTPSKMSQLPDIPSTPSQSLQIRHPLSHNRDRPPPDSPVDVAHSRTGLGFPDGDDDDDELVDSFADAYAYEYGTARTMRVQQTQSMLAFPTLRNAASDPDVAAESRGRALHHVASFAGPSSSSAEVFFSSPIQSAALAGVTTKMSPTTEKRSSKSPLSPAYKEAYPFSRPMSDGSMKSSGQDSPRESQSPRSPYPDAALQSAPVGVTTFSIKDKKVNAKRPASMPMSVISSSSSENEKPWGYF